MSNAKLSCCNALGGAFVRAKADPSWRLDDEDPADFAAEDDTFFLGIATAEIAANHEEIDCAACGSKDVCRTPLTNPWMFRTVTDPTGALYGYALCSACADANREQIMDRVDAAFDRAMAS
jgi:hypothetical protein